MLQILRVAPYRRSIPPVTAALAVAISAGLFSAMPASATDLSPARTISWPSPRPFVDPQAIAADPTGERIYVADTGRNRIEEFSAEGVVLRAWGKRGTSRGRFMRPTGVAADREGHVYVADSGNGRVQEFDENGKFIRVFSVPFAYKVATAPGNRVYVLTSFFQLVAVRSSTGDDLGAWRAIFPGKFWTQQGYEDPTSDAAAITTNAQGNVLVAGLSSQALSDPPPDCHAVAHQPDWEDPLRTGEVTSFSGGGTALASAWLSASFRDCFHGAHGYGLPRGLAVDPNDGGVYAADAEHHIDVLPGNLGSLNGLALPCPQCDPDPSKYFSTDPRDVAFDCRSNLYVLTPDRVVKYRSPGGTSSHTCVHRISLERLLVSDAATVKSKGIWITVDCTRATCGGVLNLTVKPARCSRSCQTGRGQAPFRIRRGGTHRLFVPADGVLQQLIKSHTPLELVVGARLGKHRLIRHGGVRPRWPSRLTIDCPTGGTAGKPLSVGGRLTPARSSAPIDIAATTSGVSGIHQHARTDAQGRWSGGLTPTRAGLWAIDADAAGNGVYGSAHAGCQVRVAPAPSSLTLACPSSGHVGAAFSVSGRLTPTEGKQPILVTYISPSGRYLSRAGASGSDGSYHVSFAPDEGGQWTAIASWNGDASHARANSKACHIAVSRLAATLTLDCPSGPGVVVTPGSDYTFTGRLTPAAAGSRVALTYQRSSGQLIDNATTGAAGYYSDKVHIGDFGNWTVNAHFAGDAKRKPADAPTCSFFAHYP